MVLDPLNFLTRADIRRIHAENLHWRAMHEKSVALRRSSRRLMTIIVLLTALNIGIAAWSWLR